MERRVYDQQDPQGDELVRALLEEMEEDELVSKLIGVDLTPPGPDPSHAPIVRPPREDWYRRNEEVHAYASLERLRRQPFGQSGSKR